MNVQFSEIELRKLDLNLLLTFAAVMRERSVARAASRLYLGPSAVSMALNRLRETIGDPLFVRASSGMEPTSRAQELWKDIEPALMAIESAVRGIRVFDPATVTRDVRFAAPDDLEFVLIPRLLKALAEQAPGVRMIVRPSDYRTLLGRLDSGDADLALSATPPVGIEPRHRSRHLHDEVFAVLYDRDMLGCTGDLDFERWVSTPQALLSVSGNLSGAIDTAIASDGRDRTILVGLSHFPTAPFVLRSCPSLINMPATAAHFYAKAFDLDLAAPPFASPTFPVSITWHLRSDADPFHAWFRDLVAAEVEALFEEARADGDLTRPEDLPATKTLGTVRGTMTSD